MADQADERLKALKASMKEALGKLTGSDELEAQGARERSAVPDRKTSAVSDAAPPETGSRAQSAAPARARPAAKKGTASHGTKVRAPRAKP